MRELNRAPIQLILKFDFSVEEICSVAGGKRALLKARVLLAHLRPHRCSEDHGRLTYLLCHLRLSHLSRASSLPQS